MNECNISRDELDSLMRVNRFYYGPNHNLTRSNFDKLHNAVKDYVKLNAVEVPTSTSVSLIPVVEEVVSLDVSTVTVNSQVATASTGSANTSNRVGIMDDKTYDQWKEILVAARANVNVDLTPLVCFILDL